MTALARNFGEVELRDYQSEGVDAVFRIWEEDPVAAPLLVLPTGAGKSLCSAEICRRSIIETRQRVLCVIHVKELVAQNYAAFRKHWPSASAGIFSASLGRKDRNSQVTFANIQSIARAADQFNNVGTLIVDEAHLISHGQDGQYHTLIKALRAKNPRLRVCGMTATPWRLGSGNLCEPYGDQAALFTEVAYELPMTELLKRGYLSPMVARKSKQKMDVSGVHKRGGEFIEKELDAAVNKEELNRAIIAETVEVCADRKSWLIFGVSVDHARRLRDLVRSYGITCELVSGETPQAERDRIIRDFRAGRIRAISNCLVMSTGFDAPEVDAVVMCRPTQSPGLFVQAAGRGLRIAPSKKDCLLLDFAGNTHRHGLLTHINGIHKKKKEGEDTKDCPKCDTINDKKAEHCTNCGHVFQKGQAPDQGDREAKLFKSQTTDRVMAAWEEGIEGVVIAAHCKPHVAKNTGITTLQVEYTLMAADGQQIRVWQHVCIEHEGWANKQARAWWRQRSKLPPPSTVAEAMSRLGELKLPKSLLVTKDGQWWRVESAKF